MPPVPPPPTQPPPPDPVLPSVTPPPGATSPETPELPTTVERRRTAEAASPPPEGDPLRVTPEGAAVFSSALRRVAELNMISTGGGNWRHGTIDWRTDYLMQLSVRGGTRREIDRIVRRIKLATWAAAIGAAAVVVLG